MNTKELADRLLLRELVDAVSILADKKDVHSQVQLFSENAISETFAGGKSILKLTGRKEMEAAFEGLLKDFETVSHFNGQQQLTIAAAHATGICYSLITLIGMENGKKMKTTIGAIYQDEFVLQNNKWLIARRTGNFQWQEKVEVRQAANSINFTK